METIYLIKSDKGYWSEQYGWVGAEAASIFIQPLDDIASIIPQNQIGDARWIPYSERRV